MKKLISFISVVFLFTFLLTTSHAMTVAWDAYTDTEATDLRIYHSLDQSTWSLLVDSIPTNIVASEIPDNPNDQERVYYMMRAYDSGEDAESGNSNVISYFWTTGGGGHTGPAGVGGVSLIDCGPLDTISDDGSPEWDICQGRHNKQ